MYADIPEALRALIEPIVRDHGLELVDADLARGRPPWRLRVIVDTPEMDGRVAIERCAALSREIGARLDAADAVQASYLLEVTSPGFDRVLAREKDFAAACGSELKLETREPIDGRRRFRGRLLAFEGGLLRLSVDGREAVVPFADVARAQTVYEFSREDFARAAGRGPQPRNEVAR